MHIRPAVWWRKIRDGQWFIPAVLTLLAALLAIGLTELERALALEDTHGMA